MSAPIFVIGVDPGQRGAIASCCTDTLPAVAVRFANGSDGYYGDAFGFDRAVDALLRAARDAGWRGLGTVVVVLESLGKWRSKRESVSATETSTRAHQDWRSAVAELGFELFERPTQWLDRNAGLERKTRGGRNRKAEVALFVSHLAAEGYIDVALDDLIPPGMRTLSDGATDAILFMVAGRRVLGGGKL